MNYVTGLSIGLSIGQQIYSLFGKKEPSVQTKGFILMHSLPGRRRYKNALLVGNQALADAWQQQMLRLPQVKRVVMNINLGTFLIEYICPENHIDRLMLCLSGTEAVETADKAAECSKTPLGRVGMKIRGFFACLNAKVREISGQEWDLSTLCAVIFSIMGLNKVITLRQFPSGPQMLWWAFGMLKGRPGVC